MDKYLKKVDSNWYRQRLNGVIFIALAVFVLLTARLFYLQAIEGEEYRRLSENNSIRLRSIDATRGLILDRNGEVLVDNRPSFDLSIVLKDARPVGRTIAKIARYTREPLDFFQTKISDYKNISAYRPMLLKKDIGRDMLAVIEAHKFELPGTVVNIKPRRHYVYPLFGAHLIGYLGEINAVELKADKYDDYRQGDPVGRFGVEKTFETILRGTRGGSQVKVDATGQLVRVLNTVDARAGHNIFLTIDQRLQKKTEALLAGHAGAAVAIEPGTGKILALASSPSFDQNAFVSGMSHEQWKALVTNPRKPLQNKAVQGEYPPASTFKIITAMAAIEEGVIDTQSTFFCTGAYRFGDRVFRCWKKGGHGKVNIYRALAESCDVFFYQVGQRLGIDRLAWYAKACGLSTRTKIDLDHESRGLVPTAAWKKRRTGIPWQQGETLSVAIGQGYNLATPLQMSVLMSAVANGGTRYRPLILERIETADGKVIKTSEPERTGRLPISRKTLDIVRKGLWQVVNGPRGTARKIRIKGLAISGKTGTAQVFSRKTDEEANEKDRAAHLRPHAWFVAYAPSEDARIAIAVMVEHGEHGSSMAAPIAKEMIATYFQEDGLSPKVVARAPSAQAEPMLRSANFRLRSASYARQVAGQGAEGE